MARDPLADFFPEERARKEKDGLTTEDVLNDFARAYEAKRDFLHEARQDFEFALGKQWEEQDVRNLENIGVRALTLNKIAPNLQLLKGIESQNRSDPRAFPEGDEDTVKAEIATRLMRNAVKPSKLNYALSDCFEAGNTGGEGYIEPWLEYPYRVKPDGSVDLTGELRFKSSHYDTWLVDPDSKEYDFSDAAYLCKITTDVSREKLISMFPAKKNEIEDLEGGKFDFDQLSVDRNQSGVAIQRREYRDDGSSGAPWLKKGGFDLIDYHFKKYVTKYYIADFKMNQVRYVPNGKKAAERYIKKATSKDRDPKKPSAKLIERSQPEIWTAFITAGMDDFLAIGPAWSFPRWKSWPAFRYCCYFSNAPLDPTDRHLLVQGITRRAKDNQREHNKRRTQELRHLNQSTNSGWIAEERSLVDEAKWETSGSMPGFVGIYKQGSQRPERITPTPLSQGHAQMAEEHQKDMRDTLGIDRESLAIQSGDLSGRAIALRQKQGMVMLQQMFDNLSRTKYDIYKFVLSQLSELYDIEKSMRVLGPAFMNEHFQKPVVDQLGQPMIDPQTGQPAMEFDEEAAAGKINEVLNDSEMGIFDVAVGESVSSETVKLSEYLELKDMAEAGFPIPPEVLLDASGIPEHQKRRILAATQAAQAAAAAGGAPQAPPRRRRRN